MKLKNNKLDKSDYMRYYINKLKQKEGELWNQMN